MKLDKVRKTFRAVKVILGLEAIFMSGLCGKSIYDLSKLDPDALRSPTYHFCGRDNLNQYDKKELDAYITGLLSFSCTAVSLVAHYGEKTLKKLDKRKTKCT